MAADEAFQKSVLAFANKNDAAGLTAFLQKNSPNSTVSITKVADFFLLASFTVKGHQVTICVSSALTCDGTNASLKIVA
jgi:hypothetical protein